MVMIFNVLIEKDYDSIKKGLYQIVGDRLIECEKFLISKFPDNESDLKELILKVVYL